MNTRNGSEELGRFSSMDKHAASMIVQVALRQRWIAKTVKNPILRKQCRLVGRNLRGEDDWQKRMQPTLARLVRVLAEKTNMWEEVPVWLHPIVPTLVRMCAYEENWIRAPEEWLPPHQSSSPRAMMRSLLEHVFVRYHVPSFLYHAWQVRGELRWRERDWFVLLAQGSSWRDLPGLPPTISRRALHECAKAPADLSICQGLRWGQVLASGGSEVLAREVVTSRMAHDMSNDAWWVRLIGKFSAAGEKCAACYGVVSDMFVEMFHHDEHEVVSRLLKLPMRELRAHAWNYWRDACDALAIHLPEWEKRGLTHPSCRMQISSLMRQCWHPMLSHSLQGRHEFHKGIIELRELTSAAQLIAEGREMKHCVATRSHVCLSRDRSILSIVIHYADEEERLTMEVCRETRAIKQTKGRYNRAPSPMAWHCLEQWATEMGWMVA